MDKAVELIVDLVTDPERFDRAGRAYELLEEYLEGYPVESLRALLGHNEPIVRRVASWIASELGPRACALMHAVAALVSDSDRRTAYHALEVVAVCSEHVVPGRYDLVLCALENPDQVLRRLAMTLLGNARSNPLAFVDRGKLRHELGDEAIRALVAVFATGATVGGMDDRLIDELLRSAVPVVRRCGAIAARRRSPATMEPLLAASGSDDPDVAEYARSMVRVLSAPRSGP